MVHILQSKIAVFLMIEFHVAVAYLKNIQDWEYQPTRDNEEFLSNVLWTLKIQSSMECGIQCTKDPNCLSYTWNSQSLSCKGFKRIFFSTAPTTINGNVYYTRKDYCISKQFANSPSLPVIPLCYKYYPTELDTLSSIETCAASSGHLLRIRSLSTINWIAQYLKDISAANDVTIDGNDTAVKYDWRYSDGSAVTYIKWAPAEPSSTLCGGCEERCLALQDRIIFIGAYFAGYNNMPCEEPRPFLCELSIYA